MRRFPLVRASILRIKDLWSSLSLNHQFVLAGAPLGIFSLCLLGAWIPQKIEEGVEAHSAARTALYMERLVAPHLQELAHRPALSEGSIQALDDVLAGDARRIGVLAIKVWTGDGIVAYPPSRADIDKKEKVTLPMTRAWAGYLEAELVERPLPARGDEANSCGEIPGGARLLRCARNDGAVRCEVEPLGRRPGIPSWPALAGGSHITKPRLRQGQPPRGRNRPQGIMRSNAPRSPTRSPIS